MTPDIELEKKIEEVARLRMAAQDKARRVVEINNPRYWDQIDEGRWEIRRTYEVICYQAGIKP